MKKRRFSESIQLKAGVLLSYGRMATSTLIMLLYTPIMLNLLGKNEYGLYSTVASAISTLSVLDMGFSSAYIRFFSKYQLENAREKICKLNGLFLTFYLLISAMAVLCGIYLSFHLDLVFDQGLTAAEQEKARIMMLILSANLALTFLTSVVSAYVRAHERFIFMQGLQFLQTLISPFIQLPLLLMGYGSVGMTVVLFSLHLATSLITLGYAVKELGFRISFGAWEQGLLKSVFCFSGLITLNLIVDQVNNNVDNLLLARFCGTAEVAVYAVGATLCSYYDLFSTSISGVFAPRVHRLVNAHIQDSSEQRHALTEIFVRVGRIQFLILALIVSGFIVFGREFILLWAGEGYDAAYWVCVCRMLPATIALVQNVGIEIQRAEDRHHYRAYIYFFMAFINVVLTVWLCQIYGSVGAAFATGLACVIGPGILMNLVYHKRINIDVLVFWKNILRQLAGMVIPFAIGGCIMRFAKTNTVISLLLWIGIYSVIYFASVWALSMNDEEKDFLRGFVRKLRRH